MALFDEWRAFEPPPLSGGAPDYRAPAMAQKLEGLKTFQSRLAALVPDSWSRDQQVDHALVRAQLNGHEFHLRVLQPWVRDPAFYRSIWTEQSDTPEHEGPTHHAVVELWTYAFPLSAADEARLTVELRTIPPLLSQARGNLTGNARDLWITGTGTMRTQVADLEALAQRAATAGAPLRAAIAEASTATNAFVQWLESQAPSKTGPSGIGKEPYTWSLRNVHLVPLSWEDEVVLLERELSRAHASLKLEEQRNQGLPPLTLVRNEEEFAARAGAAATKYMAFLEDKSVLTVPDYHNPRAREIVWIMLAQRAARGLASLRAQANEFDITKAKAFQVQWTPRGWMRPDLDLLGEEQQLYLRQPGYGSSYVTGKALIDELIRVRARQLGESFTLRGFFDDVSGAGMMPVSLIRWQLTGDRWQPGTGGAEPARMSPGREASRVTVRAGRW